MNSELSQRTVSRKLEQCETASEGPFLSSPHSTLSAPVDSSRCLLATGKSRFTLAAPVTTLDAWEHCLCFQCKTHLRFRCITNGLAPLFHAAVERKPLRMWLVVGVSGCLGCVLTVARSPLPANTLACCDLDASQTCCRFPTRRERKFRKSKKKKKDPLNSY